MAQDGKVTIHLGLDSIPTGVWDGDIKLFLQDEQPQQNQPQNYNQQNQPQGYQQNNAPQGQQPQYQQR